MIDYLTKNATFKCLFSPLVTLTPKENVNRLVTHNGSLVLTNSVTLEGRGICLPNLLNVPVPVQCECSLLCWLNVDSSKAIQKRSALTQLSFNICKRALPKVPSPIIVANSGVHGRLCKGLDFSFATPALESFTQNLLKLAASDEPLTKDQIQPLADNVSKFMESERDLFIEMDSGKSAERKDEKDGVKDDAQSVEKPVEKKKTVEKPKDTPVAEGIAMKFRCVACNRECEYRMMRPLEEHTETLVRKDASALKNNYLAGIEKTVGFKFKGNKYWADDPAVCNTIVSAINNNRSKFTDADVAYFQSLVRRSKLIQENGREPWTYAAHHILPGKEVFGKLDKCYRIGSLFVDSDPKGKRRVFDINEAENCIMLLTGSSSEKYDSLFDNWLRKPFLSNYKKWANKNALTKMIRDLFPVPDEAEQFCLMCAAEDELKLKIQWHNSHHSDEMHGGKYVYKFRRDEPPNLKEALEKKFGGKEHISYSEAVKNEMLEIEDAIDLDDVCLRKVREKILRVSRKVRQKLSDFAMDQCSSYPYFVTKTNYFYALRDELFNDDLSPKG